MKNAIKYELQIIVSGIKVINNFCLDWASLASYGWLKLNDFWLIPKAKVRYLLLLRTLVSQPPTILKQCLAFGRQPLCLTCCRLVANSTRIHSTVRMNCNFEIVLTIILRLEKLLHSFAICQSLEYNLHGQRIL